MTTEPRFRKNECGNVGKTRTLKDDFGKAGMVDADF